MATLYGLVLCTESGWIDKSMVPPAYTIYQSDALDADKLDARCKEEGQAPPRRGGDGKIDVWGFAKWLDGGTVKMAHQAMSLVFFALGAGTLISAACGISCMRDKPAGEAAR